VKRRFGATSVAFVLAGCSLSEVGAPDAGTDAGIRDAGAAVCEPGPGGRGIVLAARQHVKEIVVDRGFVYWTDDPSDDPASPKLGGVFRVPIDGCGMAELLTGATPIVRPLVLTVSGDTLYFATLNRLAFSTGSVSSVPIAGGTPTLIADQQNDPRGLAVDGGKIYWTAYQTGALWSQELTPGAAPTEVLSATVAVSNPAELVRGPSGLFWTSAVAGGGVFGLPLPLGAPPQRIAFNPWIPYTLRADGTNLFFCEGQGPERVLRVPMAGGTAVPLAVAPDHVFALDGTDLYFTSSFEQRVYRVSKSANGTTTPEPVADGLPSPNAIAVDQDNLYVGCQDGPLLQLPKH
jgi:hypothetical protein